jgi:ascorbate PTS system EIIA or EIIAB component
VTAVIEAAVGVPVDSWQAAIAAACQPLVEGGSVEERYAERCIEIVTEHGPYIVVAPGIALAHARPEDGAKALGLSVVTLADAVDFSHPHNDPVDVVFAFASPDDQMHVRLLTALAAAIENGLDTELRRAKDKTAARAALEKVMVDE